MSRLVNCLQLLWRCCNICMCVFFSLASYVQVNDPDGLLWMAAYAVPAALCLWVSVQPDVTEVRLWRRVADLHTLISVAIASMLAWSVYQRQVSNIFQQEEGRECAGLFLSALWLLLVRHSGRRPVGALRVFSAAAVTAFPIVAWIYYSINQHLRTSWPSHCKTAL